MLLSEGKNIFPWFIMILMLSVTFVGILSELLPSSTLSSAFSSRKILKKQPKRSRN